MDLRVWITSPAPLLERVLQQEGIPYLISDVERRGESPDIVAAFSGDIKRLKARLVVTNHLALSRALGVRAKSYMASEFVHRNNRGHSYARVFSANFSFLKGFKELGNHSDLFGREIPHSGIAVGSLDGKYFISLPWKMGRIFSHWSRWPLYLKRRRQMEDLFCETVPLVDDRLVREVVFESLALGYHTLRAPLLRVSPKIAGPGYIVVRIDADGHSTESTERVKDLAKSLGVRFSWFIDTWSWRGEGATISELARDNEVGLHSYFHATSVWRRANLRNIRKGIDFLSSLGVEKFGFVAPYGHSNKGLEKAIAVEGFRYSSEFAASCDVFPFLGGTRQDGSVIQIPTIPISLGVWTGRTNYWAVLQEEIQVRISDAGFSIIYDHPLNRLEHQVGQLRSLIQSASQRGHEFITMAELSQIIATRPRIKTANFAGGVLSHTLEGREGPHFFVEEIRDENYLNTREGSYPEAGIGRQSAFTIAWKKTVFFGIMATVPIAWQLAWSKIRGWIFGAISFSQRKGG